METNVDTRRISLVELQTVVSLGIWSWVHKYGCMSLSFLIKHIWNWKGPSHSLVCGQQSVNVFLTC